MKTFVRGIAVLFLSSVLTSTAFGQRFYPRPEAIQGSPSLAKVQDFIGRYDPATFHYPAQALVSGAVIWVRQPTSEYCRRDQKIDAFGPFRHSSEITPQGQNIIRAALESSKVCGGPFAGANNQFGRVPAALPLKTLRSLVGSKQRVVDYRLASPEERAACTREIVRPLPRYTPDYTFASAYANKTYVAYDVGPTGQVVNARLHGPGRASMRDVRADTASQSVDAAARSQFRPPVLNGTTLYCINITEQMLKIGDGNGGVSSRRAYVDVFFEDDSNNFGF